MRFGSISPKTMSTLRTAGWTSSRKAIQLLADTPGVGHVRRDLTDRPVLFWPVGRYLLIYRADRQPIEIVRVVSAYRDVSSFL